MDVKYINPFIQGTLDVLSQLGMADFQRSGMGKKERLQSEYEVNVIIGLVEGIKGNVVLAMPEKTACNIASTMMGGLPVEQFDLMAKSAICELSNMIAGHSVNQMEKQGIRSYITPPTLISGRNLKVMINQVETLAIEFTGQEGKFELNIGLEI